LPLQVGERDEFELKGLASLAVDRVLTEAGAHDWLCPWHSRAALANRSDGSGQEGHKGRNPPPLARTGLHRSSNEGKQSP
jgi:hypothetical protein